MNYLVTWSMELEADSPLDAAKLARKIQLDPDSLATEFEVEGKELSSSIELSEHTRGLEQC